MPRRKKVITKQKQKQKQSQRQHVIVNINNTAPKRRARRASSSRRRASSSHGLAYQPPQIITMVQPSFPPMYNAGEVSNPVKEMGVKNIQPVNPLLNLRREDTSIYGNDAAGPQLVEPSAPPLPMQEFEPSAPPLPEEEEVEPMQEVEPMPELEPFIQEPVPMLQTEDEGSIISYNARPKNTRKIKIRSIIRKSPGLTVNRSDADDEEQGMKEFLGTPKKPTGEKVTEIVENIEKKVKKANVDKFAPFGRNTDGLPNAPYGWTKTGRIRTKPLPGKLQRAVGFTSPKRLTPLIQAAAYAEDEMYNTYGSTEGSRLQNNPLKKN